MIVLRSATRRAWRRAAGPRWVSTLPDNPQIARLRSRESSRWAWGSYDHDLLTLAQYVHRNPDKSHLLSLLPTEPPTPALALGTTSAIPPTPRTFTENKAFYPLLMSVLRQHAADDPTVQAEAVTYASPGGSTIFSARKRKGVPSMGSGAGAANYQGGMGGGGTVGWLHVHDERNLPPFGRIPDPEDIFGSVEVTAEGKTVKGTWEECTAYRLITRDGMMRLSGFLREKVIEALEAEERKAKG